MIGDKHVFRIEVIEKKDNENEVRVMVKGNAKTIGISLGLSSDKEPVNKILDYATMVMAEKKMDEIIKLIDKDIPDIINEARLRDGSGVKN